MQFRTVLFDLDGTLIDHLRAIHRCYSHTLPQLGYPAPTVEEVRRAIGGGLENAMRKFVPEKRLQEALAIYRPYWDSTMLDDPEIMPGGRELLEWINAKGVICGVMSNKHGPSSRLVCEHLGLGPLLKGVFGALDTAWIKPQPEFSTHVLTALGAEAGSTLMVGDSPFDVQTSLNGGFAASWSVTTGTHTAEQLKQAGSDLVFENLWAVQDELKKHL